MNSESQDLAKLAKHLGLKFPEPQQTQAEDEIETNQAYTNVLKSIAKTIQKGRETLFKCSRCDRFFRITNAKEGQFYKCLSCGAVLDEVASESISPLKTESAELILDEAIPRDVQESLKDPNNVFGRYVLVEMLGEGGMGSVYRAFDVELSRYVALKFIKSDKAQELKIEARTLAGLEHKNIARVYDIGSAKEKGFIAMQYITGKPLMQMSLSAEKALDVIRIACEAVEYAHKSGVIHRDINPDNIMMDSEGTVFVTDFGIAVKNPRAGTAAGTPGYMAPEVAEMKRPTVRSDVYSLAATLYFLLSQSPPMVFEDSMATEEIFQMIKKNDIVPIRKLLPTISPELEAIIIKGLKHNPYERYKNPSEMACDISRFLTGYPVRAYSAGIIYYSRKMIIRNKVVAAIIFAAVIILLGLSYFGVMRLRQEQAKQEALKREAQERENMLMELSSLWSSVVISKQGWYQLQKDPFETRRKIEDAVQKISELIERHPRQVQAYYVRARALLYLDALEAAEQDLKKALELEPDFAPGWALLGRLKLQQYNEKISQTEEISERLIKAKPLLEHAQEAFKKGWHGNAEKMSLKRWGLQKLEEEDVAETLAYALLAAHVQKDVAKACKILEEANTKSPSEEYCYWLGCISSEPEKQIGWHTEAIRIMPYFMRAYLERGSLKVQEGDYKGAIEDFTKALKINPRYDSAYSNCAVARVKLGDYKGAIEDCTKALEINPENTGAYRNRGVAKWLLGDGEGAIKDYTEALKIDPHSSAAYCNRGASRVRLGDYNGGIEDYTKALKINPHNDLACYNRGTAKFRMEDYKGAIEDYTEAIKINPQFVQAYGNRGVARELLASQDVSNIENLLRMAEEDLEKALELDRENLTYQEHLKRVREKLENLKTVF